jgi:hypothetical protein
LRPCCIGAGGPTPTWDEFLEWLESADGKRLHDFLDASLSRINVAAAAQDELAASLHAVMEAAEEHIRSGSARRARCMRVPRIRRRRGARTVARRKAHLTFCRFAYCLLVLAAHIRAGRRATTQRRQRWASTPSGAHLEESTCRRTNKQSSPPPCALLCLLRSSAPPRRWWPILVVL